jgi:hypothetical protein
MSLESTEAECAANAVAPRVSLANIEAAVAARYDMRGDDVVGSTHVITKDEASRLALLSICILVLRNGFIVVGKSAPASRENFNAELGKKLAYEDCIRQLWPLMGFVLRERLAKDDA